MVVGAALIGAVIGLGVGAALMVIGVYG